MESIMPLEWHPYFWLVLGIVLAGIEAFTVQLVAVWFAIGAVAAIVPAMMGAPMQIQFLVFVVVSALSMALTRPFCARVLHVKKQRTNMDRVIGETGVVQQPIDNDLGQGRVLALGLDWSARSRSGTPIEQGVKVKVLAIEGVKLIVEPKSEQE